MAQKILIADDSIASQRLFEMVLTREGYDVITVGSGNEVLDRVKEKRPDIALIDTVMPETDSYQLCETLQQHPDFKHLPIILLGGTYEGFDQAKSAQLVGEHAILNKPAKSTVIISKIKEILEQQQAQSAEQTPVTSAQPLKAEVVEEPPMVAEEYEFDEDSEELDMVVEDEFLEEGAEFEEVIDMQEPKEEMVESVDETEEFSLEDEETTTAEITTPIETPVAEKPEPAGTVTVSNENLDALVNEITQRLAGKLVPLLIQELASSFLQTPTMKKALEETSQKLVKELLPEIQKKL